MAATIIPIARYFNPTLILAIGLTSITTIKFLNGAGLAVEFNVTRTLTNTPDSCSVKIAGLDPLRAELMGANFRATGKSKLNLRLGYDGVTAGVFAGDVRKFVSQRRAGADTWTDADADDGGDAVANARLPDALKCSAKLTAENMVDIAAGVMELIVPPQTYAVIRSTNVQAQGEYTCVATSMATDLLDAAARRVKCRWWIRDGQLFFTQLGLADKSRPAIQITPQTLVGDIGSGGVGMQTLPVMFDPNIVQGGQVAYLGTLFRVEQVVHSGSTRGGLWTSVVEGRAL